MQKLVLIYFIPHLYMIFSWEMIFIYGTDIMNIIFEKRIVQRSYPNIDLHINMFDHFKKSASILTDQDTQMIGNDQWPATIWNTATLTKKTHLETVLHKKSRKQIFQRKYLTQFKVFLLL